MTNFKNSTLPVAVMFGSAMMAFSALMFGQASAPVKAGAVAPKEFASRRPARGPVVDAIIQRNIESWKEQGRGVPEDWTHHRVVFSSPGTEAEADAAEQHDRWHRIAENPRFTMQRLRRGGVQGFDNGWGVAELTRGRASAAALPPSRRGKVQFKGAIEKDWAEGVGGGTINPDTFPAKWSFSTSTASCTNDFVIYPTGSAGSSSQADILAYYNLYASGCSGTVPSVAWAYNTGGTVSTSPVFSSDGSRIAFIQTSGSVASLTLLRLPALPGTGTLGAPTTVANQATAAAFYNGGSGCTAPCRWSVALNGSPNDSWSSPFYDYGTDTLYVGDSAGKLHRFSPVFGGALTEITASWPVDLSASDNTQTTSPVFDATSGKVFVGTFGGRVYSVGTGNAGTMSGQVTGTSAQLDGANGIRDAVLLDSSAGRFYVFVGRDTNSGNASGVYQFSTGFTAASNSEVRVNSAGGTGVTALQMTGDFDNQYYTSASASNPSGNLYMCDTGLTGKLYKIPITANAISTSSSVASLSDTTLDGRCSPITEFYNANADGTAATGSITIQTDPGNFPANWGNTRTVTVGSVTYTFMSSVSSANQVLRYTNFFTTAATREAHTAQNLRAAIDGNLSECADTNCFGTGTVDNPAVTTSVSTNTVSLTASSVGAGNDFTLTTNYATGIAVSGGSNGTTVPADLVFFSVLGGTPSGCTDAGNSGVDGCVLAYDVTNPAAVSQEGTGLNIIAGTSGSRTTTTGGIVVDNASTLAGAAQIYFLTTYAANGSCSTAGTGICATQASQTSP